MFARLVMKSIWVRRERFLIAVVAIMLAAAMVTSLLTISFDIKERMGKELRSYGANLIILPQEGEYINQFNATQPSITGFAPFLYFNAEINSKRFEFAGIDVQATRKISPWWHIDGKIPENEEVLLGVNAAVKLGLKTGDVLNLKTSSFKVSGVLDTGTSDDDKIFMPMEAAEKISGKSGATLVQLSVVGDIEEVIKSLESENYRVKKVRQVAESEKALLDKTQLLLSLVALFVLSASSLSLLSTMITGVLERSREIGLMKAIGCGNYRLANLFLAEAGVIGAVGGILGYLAGLLLSQFIGMEVFRMSVSVKPEIFALTIFISILVALIGGMLPVRRALAIDPVITLRGE